MVADDGFGAGAVGTAGHQGLPGSHPGTRGGARAGVDGSFASCRQRARPDPPSRPSESSQLMSITILRTVDDWWVRNSRGAVRIDTDATTTGELLAALEEI